jgi:hypothetical protein
MDWIICMTLMVEADDDVDAVSSDATLVVLAAVVMMPSDVGAVDD